MKCILVYDIGTTSLKSALITLQGEDAGSVSISYATSYPAPGMAEQDPEIFWTAAVRGTRQLMKSGKVNPKDIQCIGLSGHMNGALPVEADGRIPYPELIHSDSRSSEECSEILHAVPHETVYKRTGNRVDEHLSLPKILWIKNHRPDVYKKTAYFLNSKDYLRYRLTGILGETDYSDGSLTGAMEIRKRNWDFDFLKELGLSAEKFPALRKAAEIAGTLTDEAAHVLEIPSGIPVSYGGGDAACSSRGAGVKDNTKAYASIGSSAWVSTLTDEPVLDEHMRMQNFYDLDGKKCNFCGTVQSAGIAVDWVHGITQEDGEGKAAALNYREKEEGLDGIPPGSDGVIFLPYLMGERTPHWDAQSRAAFVGFSLYHGKKAMLRSVYEGTAFALKEILSIYHELDFSIDEFFLLGGGVRSEFWRNIICDILALPVRVHTLPTQAASLGAAMAAGTAAGIWDNLDQAVSISKFGERQYPETSRTEIYDGLFSVYKSAYHQMKPLYRKLAELRSQ
ncbi:MAG: hypothetical protein K9L75_02335 [Spirochaetia bacterium]|nr:hypothetical protein [Spirochaetia bacterium]